MLAWGNLSQGLAPQLSAYLYQTQGRVWTDFYKATFYSAAGIILVFMLVNICFIKLGPQRLNTLSGLPRIICVTHVAFFTIFLGTSVPYSIGLIRVLFASGGWATWVQPTTYRCIAYPLALQLVMYAAEGSLRAVCRVNVFLIIHHIMFCLFLVLALEGESIFVLKVDLIVSCFATYEFLLYASLIARRLDVSTVVVKTIMAAGLGFYAFSRLVQLALLVGLFAAGYSHQHATGKGEGLWWASLILSILLVVLQCYTFVIYGSMWIRLGRPTHDLQLPSTALRVDGTPVNRSELHDQGKGNGSKPGHAWCDRQDHRPHTSMVSRP